MEIVEVLKKQISLTEWFEAIKHQNSAVFRDEDAKRKDRLEILKKVIGINYDAPTAFLAEEVIKQTPKFKKFLKKHGDETCGLRLNPLDSSLPKLRLRGKTIKESLAWLQGQNIDPQKYQIDFIPHSNHQLWSTIFIVNKNGIFGEITAGGHYQLTAGFYDTGKPAVFSYNFKTKKLKLGSNNLQSKKHLEEAIKQVRVTDKTKQQKLKKLLGADFYNDYLCGYFETLRTEDFGLWVIDFNREIGKLYQDFSINVTPQTALSGRIGSQGKATGKVKIVAIEDIKNGSIAGDEILVCEMTTPDYLPLMARCAAIVTEYGGILSHAAIISRELKKPCLTAINNVTKILKNGDVVEVDAINGIVRIIN